MDRRTVLAFVLMFIVYMVWSAVFLPKKGELPEGEDGTATEELAGTPIEGVDPFVDSRQPVATSAPERAVDDGETISERSAESGWIDLAEASEGPVLRITSDHYLAEIDLVGADIRSWQLRNFQTVEGELVQLIPDRSLDGTSQRAHALRLFTEDRILDLRRVQFTPTGADLTATADPNAPYELSLSDDLPESSVELVARTHEGSTLRLRLSFSNDGHSFNVNTNYSLAGNAVGLHRLEIAWPGGIAHTEPDSVREYNEFKAVARVGADIHKRKYSDLKSGDGSKGRRIHDGTVEWAGVMAKYFTTIVRVAEGRTGTVRFDGDHASAIQTFSMDVPLASASGPGLEYLVYLGPLDYEAMEEIDPDAAKLVELGPRIFRPIARFLLWLMIWMHQFIPNYGIVIILVSTLTKIVTYPLSKSSTRSMREMQMIQPEIQKLKEKHKDDQQRQSQEMFALYKEHKINPMGSCLPMLLQMPVMWPLFFLLRYTIELRQANFMLWISDLSLPDVLFKLPFSLPILGDNFCVLPILMGLGMYVQTKMSGTTAPSGGGTMAAQAKMMTTVMPIMFFVLFYNSPSGLVLYWFINSLLTMGQTWWIHQRMPTELVTKAKPA